MPDEQKLSPNAEKLCKAMKEHGVIGEAKMASADTLTYPTLRMPKNLVLNALQELISKGYAKRKAREKSAGYYLIEGK